VITGGVAVNSVPKHASCQINLRHSAETTASELLAILSETVALSKVNVLGSTPALSVAEDTPTFQLFCEALVEQGGSAAGVREHGTCDASFFVGVARDILITKPESSLFHIYDEWVSLSSLVKLYAALENFSLRLCASAVKPNKSRRSQLDLLPST
jgi:acetylornithine deacetylase/succinyl-diaminopimelate desuccinylase-like protein